MNKHVFSNMILLYAWTNKIIFRAARVLIYDEIELHSKNFVDSFFYLFIYLKMLRSYFILACVKS